MSAGGLGFGVRSVAGFDGQLNSAMDSSERLNQLRAAQLPDNPRGPQRDPSRDRASCQVLAGRLGCEHPLAYPRLAGLSGGLDE